LAFAGILFLLLNYRPPVLLATGFLSLLAVVEVFVAPALKKQSSLA